MRLPGVTTNGLGTFMELWSSVAEPVGMDRAALQLPDLDVPLALFGSQEDEARRDANDDNVGDLLPCLMAIR